MKTKEIKTNLEQILEKSVSNKSKNGSDLQKSEIDFDFKHLYEELNKVINNYKSETLKKAINSERELSKSILTY